MRITSIKTYILKLPIHEKAFLSSQCPFPERNSLLVRVETDEGIYGWGEGGQYGPPEPVLSCIENVLAPRIIGLDPLKPMVISENLYAQTRDFGQRGPYVEAISALDIAMWDIKGKYHGVPICEILGGAYQEAITAYATGCYYPRSDFEKGVVDYRSLVSEAESFLQKGFKVVKIKIGLLPLSEDLKRVRAIRDTVGEDFTILIDCNHAYNCSTAKVAAKALEPLSIGFLEEPVPPEDLDGYLHLRRFTSIPIAGGECFYTSYDFRSVIEKGCLDILQPDVCVTGGFTEFMKIRGMAMASSTRLIPHVWGSGVAIAAALQAIATIPPIPYTHAPVPLQNQAVIEYDQSPNPLRDELLINNFRLQDGRVVVPRDPGLGIEINQDALERFVVR